MRVTLPEFQSKEEAFSYLRKNHDKLIALKSSDKVKSDICSLGTFRKEETKDGEAIKSEAKAAPKEDAGEIPVKAYANVIGWCDSHKDVLIRDCAKKTIKDKGASNRQLIYHLKNHGRTTDDVIGKSVKMSLEEISLSEFNIQSDIKNTQVIVGESIVPVNYDAKAYQLYKDGEVKQHSIGLFYIKIHFCMNSSDPEDATYQENWAKYYPQVINKESVDVDGYFWAVTEIKLVEYSAVLWGSNELSITAEGKGEPLEDTQTKEEAEGKSSKDTDSERKKKIRLI